MTAFPVSPFGTDITSEDIVADYAAVSRLGRSLPSGYSVG